MFPQDKILHHLFTMAYNGKMPGGNANFSAQLYVSIWLLLNIALQDMIQIFVSCYIRRSETKLVMCFSGILLFRHVPEVEIN